MDASYVIIMNNEMQVFWFCPYASHNYLYSAEHGFLSHRFRLSETKFSSSAIAHLPGMFLPLDIL